MFIIMGNNLVSRMPHFKFLANLAMMGLMLSVHKLHSRVSGLRAFHTMADMGGSFGVPIVETIARKNRHRAAVRRPATHRIGSQIPIAQR